MAATTMNRLANCTNPYQGTAKKVLCLCSAGLLRSPTMANALHEEYGYNTRAAGVNPDYALIPVDEVLMKWADEVLCADLSIVQSVEILFPEHNYSDKVILLNIPDEYSWGDATLKDFIKSQYADILSPYHE